MSNIIRYLKCDHCGTEFKDIYISFGHNEYCFDYKWKCNQCNEENILKVKSFTNPGCWGSKCNCEERKAKLKAKIESLRFKAGDRVMIKTVIDLREVPEYITLFSDQLKHIGETAIIRDISTLHGSYILCLDPDNPGDYSYWEDYMLELADEVD